MKYLITFLGCLISLSMYSQIYVDINATGDNNGTSWQNAFTHLQPALDLANDSDTIWVAEGVYNPMDYTDGASTDNSQLRSFHFTGKNISIYGGFAGDEVTLSQRDFNNNETIFSGDFNSDDVVTGSGNSLQISNNEDNAYNVFSITDVDYVTIDGCTIKGGNADHHSSFGFGNEEIHTNRGGGIFVWSDQDDWTVNIINSTIKENASILEGGGVYVRTYTHKSTLNIKKSRITNNSSVKGAGVFSSSRRNDGITEVLVEETTITGNLSSRWGGGVCSVVPNSVVTVHNSTISNNSAEYGGGIYSYPKAEDYPASSRVTVNNSTINGNSASYDGGGVYCYSRAESFFSVDDANTIIDVNYSTISDNTAARRGGGIYAESSVSNTNSETIVQVSILNSTLVDNEANSGGNSITYASRFSNNASKISTRGSILWSQSGNNIYDYSFGSVAKQSNGYNIFSDSPLFAVGSDYVNVTESELNLQSLADNGGVSQTRLPGEGSVAIDNGDPNDASDSQNRNIVGVRDIGAAERPALITSIQNRIRSNELNVYPNPATSEITIQRNSSQLAKVSLLDMNGRVILINQIVNTNVVTINLNEYSIHPGLYMVRIETDSYSEHTKIIVK